MNQIASEVLSGLPVLRTSLPGPKARQVIQRDRKILSPSYTRSYPLVAERGEGAMVEDVDGNRFLDCNAGIAVVATGHCHPAVVKSIQEQAAKLVHMSGTDFYYENMVTLAERRHPHPICLLLPLSLQPAAGDLQRRMRPRDRRSAPQDRIARRGGGGHRGGTGAGGRRLRRAAEEVLR